MTYQCTNIRNNFKLVNANVVNAIIRLKTVKTIYFIIIVRVTRILIECDFCSNVFILFKTVD